DLLLIVQLGFKPSLPGPQLIEVLIHHRDVRSRDGVVEAEDDVAGPDLIAVSYIKLPHNAACRVLDLLDVRIHHETAGRNDSTRKVCGNGPTANAANQNDHASDPSAQVPADLGWNPGVVYPHAL